MNENQARQVLLVRAAEGSHEADALLTEDDRRYAARAAGELVRWQAADRGERASAEAYVAKRAELLTEKLTERAPRSARVLSALRWRPWIGIVLPAMAFVAGVGAEQVAEPGRVNILAFPLLGIIVWNLAVYVWLFVRTIRRIVQRSRRQLGWLERLLAGARRNVTAHLAGPLAGALATFTHDWTERATPLLAARAARILHLSAAALALGAVAGMFVRGLAFEYRAGWESTFLDAPTVHALLAFFLAPAADWIGQPFPTPEELAQLRWDAGGGENAARWIYMYTVAVAATVIGPRVVLAAIAAFTERRLSRRFPLPLEDAYYRRMLSGWRAAPARVQVMPYAYTPNQDAMQGMQRLAASLFGDDVEVLWAKSIAFGEEDAVGALVQREERGAVGSAALAARQEGAGRAQRAPALRQQADLVIALFNLAATPETENHAVYLERLHSHTREALAMIIDEGPYRERLGNQAGAEARIAERRQAWSGLAQTRRMRPVFVDLSMPQLHAAQRELDALLTGGPAAA